MDKTRKEAGQRTADEAVDAVASGDWLRVLVEQTLAGIYIIQGGYFRYVNQGFADIFGYDSPVDLIDKAEMTQLIAPEDRQMVADNFRRRTEGEVTQTRYTFIGLRRDGRRIHVEVHGRRMAFKGQPAVIGLILDVTERKLAEAASNEKLCGLFELSPLGIVLTDMQGRFEEFNTAFQHICGYSEEELKSLDKRALTPSSYAADEARQLEMLDRTGFYGPYEKEYLHKDGHLVSVRLRGMLLNGRDGKKRAWFIVEDISERKQIELAHQDNLRFARQLIEVIPSPVFYKDSLGRYLGRYLGCNEAFERYLGKSRQDFVGKSVYDLSPKELADRYHAADQALFDHPGTQIYEASVRPADGSLHDVVFHKATFAKADGSVGGLVGVILDITERKRLEKEMV